MEKILIVDDENDIAELISDILEDEGYETVIANDGKTAIKLVKEENFDLVLLDVMMPDISGTEVCANIRNETSCPIIFVTAKTNLTSKLVGFEVGADDYITKPFNPLELVARVNSQMRRYTKLGNAAESSKVFQSGGLAINDDLKSVSVDGEAVRLTPIEYNILLLLVKNQGKVFSINQIYENIWNEEAIGADNTVAVHIRHIREKIEINPKDPQYLKVVWGVGYKIEKIEPR